MKIKDIDLELDQHFITDENLLKRIVNVAKIDKKDIVLEIGAGSGNLTKLLVEKAKKVIAVEKDKRFKKNLESIKAENLEIIYENILNIKLPKFDKVVSNIPYSISEPLINKLMGLNFKLGVLTVSKNFANKLLNKNYKNKLSLIVPLYFKIEKIMNVSRNVFDPKPKIDSVVIKLIPLKKINSKDRLIRNIYDQNDKKTKNALRNSFINYFKLDKKEASEFVKKIGLNEYLLNKKINMLSYYELRALIDSIFQKVR